MDKDLKRKNLTGHRPKEASRWRLLLLILLLLSVSGGFFIYHHSQAQALFAPIYSQAETWIAKHKNHLQNGLAKKIEKAKLQIGNQHETEPQIHFEFYSALSTMQVSVPVQNETKTSKSIFVANKTAKDMIKTAPAISPAISNNIYNADELEQEVSRHIKQITYFVQLGLFRNKAAADHYRETFSQDGFETTVIKANKKLYRVQLGPFADKEQAQQTQEQLKKKGVNALLRSVIEG